MSNDATPPSDAEIPPADDDQGRVVPHSIVDELKESYLTYAMSVIVSRALPDVRDGLKPSQRRILIAMNDLNLGPSAARAKCAKIAGETMGNYHPHGQEVIYPTLVRMAQEWNMRHVLVDKQGNFGSVAGLPPAAMRYTEARMSQVAATMLEDIKLDTVDFAPNYDESRNEPTVLPSKFPNLLVNGGSGIAVGMATSIPPHNLREVCDALIRVIEDSEVSIDELMEIVQGPDFPTGGIVCGRAGIHRAFHTGRGTVVVRGRTRTEEFAKNRHRIIINEIPYQQYRDRIHEKIAALATEGRIKDISAIRDESDLKEPVRLVIDLKRGADPDVVLNQLYQFSPLQDTFSLIFLALVDGRPRTLNLREMLLEFVRHRVEVIRRRTQFLLARARQRKHTVEGLLLALADIDQIIQIIRSSQTQADAKSRLMGFECPAALMQRALGDDGFRNFQEERGESDVYTLTAVQADAILKMTLGQLVNLEQERLGTEHAKLLLEIAEFQTILADREIVLGMIKEDLREISRKYGEDRKTEITGEEIGEIDLEDVIKEETMVVTISHRGYIKRTSVDNFRAQRRGGKGIIGASAQEEDPVEHLFVASTHAYLLFFTNKGKVYWQKVYGLPQLNRDRRGRAIVNLLNLDEDEKITDCRAVRDFNLPGHFLLMATRKGQVKKTALDAYSRPKRGGIIAIKLRPDDELVDVVITKPGDELLLATVNGMAIRFNEADARPMGRNASGVRGIALAPDDELVGMVVADPDAALLTACENGYGKRTTFGNSTRIDADVEPSSEVDEASAAEPTEERSGSSRYRTQRRGGKGLRDIKTTRRNGKVVGIVRVDEEDELLMMTAGGMIQRIAVKEVSVVGRNTQGVRIMKLKDGDALTAIVRVPREESAETLDTSNAVPADSDQPAEGTQPEGDGADAGSESQ
ncbi:MAG: DNA gyrase subunit A [Planctomycetaceae bacterium]|nr:DNA gyrase subunit A [Planctomycetaceae bacterium]